MRHLTLLLWALLLAALTSGLTSLAMQPAVDSLLVSVRDLSVGMVDRVDSVRRSFLILAAVNFLSSTVFLYLAFRQLWGRPLEQLESSATRALRDHGGPQRVQGVDGVTRAIDRLRGALLEEQARSDRRLVELSKEADQKARLQAELVAADRLATVGKLAAGVAHEVGNPLSGILGYLSVLRLRAQQNDQTLEVVDRIEAEVKRIDSIVRGLLEMGRPSRGKAQPLDLRPIIDSCVKMVSSMKENAQVRIEVDCPETAWVRAEAGPLAQVLVNLLLNACQSQAGIGSVRLSLALQDGEGQLFVDDEGPGIAVDVLPKLFTPFFTTKPPGQGTGLGLAVSRHLLGQFDGKLKAENRAQGGARFTISLPAP